MNLTIPQLQASTGATALRAAQWLAPVQAACDRFQINTPLRMAAWLAQCGHESAGLSQTSESFNYSVEGLIAKFSKMRRMPGIAAQLGRQPGEKMVPLIRQEKIANMVYANQLGNGDSSSGDGWRYRGSGLIQTTGRANFAALAEGIQADVLTHPQLVRDDPSMAALAAAFYWHSSGLNVLADAGKFDAITKRINKASEGAARRLALYVAAKKALGIA